MSNTCGITPFALGILGATLAMSAAQAQNAPATTPAPAPTTTAQKTLSPETQKQVLQSGEKTLWKVGIMDTWLKGGVGGMAYGGSAKIEREMCKYSDLGFRVGYMKSDCHKVTYVPLELTATFKYPLFNDRLFPYCGIGGGYCVWTGGNVSLENSFSYFPLLGIEWRFSKEKSWSLFAEARDQFMTANIISGGPPGKTDAAFDSWGGSFGVAYHF